MFFPGSHREHILNNLLHDIGAGKIIIRLIGNEGSGKTLCCKIIKDRLEEQYETIYLSDPIGSFNDVIRIIVFDLGFQLPEESSRQESIDGLYDALAQKKDDGKKVLLLIDEAEKLFLATLERLVRMACDLDPEMPLQILFAARPEFDTNLKQLTHYCSNIDIENGYVFEPLDADETGSYLDFRLKAAGITGDLKETIFSEEAVSKIFERAKGNIRLTNILAEESLQNSCSAESFMVLLEHVSSPEITDKKRKKGLMQGLSAVFDVELFKENQKLIGILGSVLAFFIILAFFLPGKEEKSNATLQENTTMEIVADKLPSESEEKQVRLEKNQAIIEDKNSISPEEVPLVESLTADGKKTAPKKQPKAKVDGEAQADTIYDERLRASAGWLAGAYRGSFTIQLMMLSSSNAEESSRKLFKDEDMRKVKDHIYILRKKTSPPTVFLFYGNYDSLATARGARNKLPLFLRKHHPYALAISDAVKKMED